MTRRMSFKHNDKLLVFPDEKVFFDIEVIEVKESQLNPLLKEEQPTPSIQKRLT